MNFFLICLGFYLPFFFLSRKEKEREKSWHFFHAREGHASSSNASFLSPNTTYYYLKRTTTTKNERGYFHPHRPSRGANRCADVSLLFLPFLSLRARISLSLSFACEMATTLLTFFFETLTVLLPPRGTTRTGNSCWELYCLEVGGENWSFLRERALRIARCAFGFFLFFFLSL